MTRDEKDWLSKRSDSCNNGSNRRPIFKHGDSRYSLRVNFSSVTNPPPEISGAKLRKFLYISKKKLKDSQKYE